MAMAGVDFGYGPDTFTNTATAELRALVSAGPVGAADLSEIALREAARAEITRRTNWLAGR